MLLFKGQERTIRLSSLPSLATENSKFLGQLSEGNVSFTLSDIGVVWAQTECSEVLIQARNRRCRPNWYQAFLSTSQPVRQSKDERHSLDFLNSQQE